MIGYSIVETEEYINWFQKLTLKEKAQIQARIVRIKIGGHFGDAKKLARNLAELRWKNGRRVYFTLTKDHIVLLLGGNKNSQTSDIRKAKAIVKKLIEDN